MEWVCEPIAAPQTNTQLRRNKRLPGLRAETILRVTLLDGYVQIGSRWCKCTIYRCNISHTYWFVTLAFGECLERAMRFELTT